MANEDAREPSSATGKALGMVALAGVLGGGGALGFYQGKKLLGKALNSSVGKKVSQVAGDMASGGAISKAFKPTDEFIDAKAQELMKAEAKATRATARDEYNPTDVVLQNKPKENSNVINIGKEERAYMDSLANKATTSSQVEKAQELRGTPLVNKPTDVDVALNTARSLSGPGTPKPLSNTNDVLNNARQVAGPGVPKGDSPSVEDQLSMLRNL
jgi:hypothetical protein